MRKYLIVILGILGSGCVKEKSSYSNVLIENTTQHHVVIIPYKLGSIDSSKLFSLSYGQEKSIESHNDPGISSGPIYFGDYFYDLDSVTVLWDDTFTVTHMISDSFYSTRKYVSFFDEHNIGKISKYKVTKESETRHRIIWTATYSFTEADYEYAKE